MSEIDNDLKYIFDSYEINYPVDDLFTEAEIKKIVQEIRETTLSPKDFIELAKEKERQIEERGYSDDELQPFLEYDDVSADSNNSQSVGDNEKNNKDADAVTKVNQNAKENSNSQFEKQRARLALKKKIMSLKMMLKSIEYDINSQFAKTNSNIKKISLDSTISSGNLSGSFTSNIDFSDNKSAINFTLDINITKIMKLPALETYALLYTNINNSVYHQISKSSASSSEVSLIKSDEVSLDDISSDNDSAKDVLDQDIKSAIKVLSSYLKEFLSDYRNNFDNVQEYNNFVELIATKVVNNYRDITSFYGQKGSINDILGNFFAFSQYELNSIKNAADFYAKNNYNVYANYDFNRERTNYYVNQSQEYTLDKNIKQDPLTAQQMAEELIKRKVNKDFCENHSNEVDFNKLNFKGDIKSANLKDLKSFCQEYANIFMQANNLVNIEIKFTSSGSLGEFVEENGKQYINVNLNSIKNRVDLMQTLSHELQHAVDASINKSQGYTNKFGGGLKYYIDEDISQAKGQVNNTVFGELKLLNQFCYRLNPNERNARRQELVGLIVANKLEQENNSGSLKEEISKCVKGYVNYQNKVINSAKNVVQYLKSNYLRQPTGRAGEKIIKLQGETYAISIPNSVGSGIRQLFEERVKYLAQIIDSEEVQALDVSKEEESIAQVESIFGEILGKINDKDNKEKEKQIEEKRRIVVDNKTRSNNLASAARNNDDEYQLN